MTFMMLCFITFALNWVFILPVSAFYWHYNLSEDSVKQDKVEFVFFILCSLFELLSTVLLLFIVYMLYQMQNKEELQKFEYILEQESRKASDLTSEQTSLIKENH